MLTLRFRRALAGVAAAALVAVGLILGTATAASAASLVVPGTYATISAAVAAAVDGDVINVAAGTYTEDVTVPAGRSLTITGAGAATTTIIGKMTLSSPSTVSGFTLQSADTTYHYTLDPLWITATGAGSVVENNVLTLGLRGAYIDSAVGTASQHTIIRHNTFANTGYDNTGAVWINKSEYVDVLNNVFTNDTPTGGTGVNLVGGSSNILIDSNSFTTFGNALTLIANSSGFPHTPQAHDITFSNNTVTDSTSTALYIGGNNIIDVNITDNTITGGPGLTAIQITPGYPGNPTAWLESDNRPLQRFVIQDNHFDGMAYGFRVFNLSQLDNDETVRLISNEFCTVSVAPIDNEITDEDRSLLAVDNTFCGGTNVGRVLLRSPAAAAATGTAGLAATGLDDSVMIGTASGGAVLIVLGAFLVLVMRHRMRMAAR